MRKKVKFDLLFSKVVEDINDAEAVRKWTIRYHDRNRQAHQVDTSDLLQIYLTNLTKTFDPHSAYMGPKDLGGHAQPAAPPVSGRNRRLAPVGRRLRGGHGDRAGTWRPTRTAGSSPRTRSSASRRDGKVIDLVEKKLNDVVRYIRGPRGTKVRLIVQPDGTKEKRDLRADPREDRPAGTACQEQDHRGQVRATARSSRSASSAFPLSTATRGRSSEAIVDAVSATSDCRKILTEYKANGIDAVVVDLRGNGGGLLDEAKTLSGLFIDTGPVVQVKEVFGVKHLDDDEDGTAWDGPLVVLIDKFSASASEIFAGVIKDYGRGLIIGDTSTFGKGTVQQIVMISDHVRRRDRQTPQPNRGASQADDSTVLPRQRREYPDQWRRSPHPHPFDE